MKLYEHGQPTMQRFAELGLAGIWLQMRSPHRTIRQLAVCLRDLHFEIRQILDIEKEWWQVNEVSDERNRALTRSREGTERCGTQVLAAFVLLRRLADELVATSAPLLFTHWKGAPAEMKNAIKMARMGSLGRLAARCDLTILSDALASDTAWFERLREADGIRDVLIHHPHFLQIGRAGVREPSSELIVWEVSAQLLRPGNREHPIPRAVELMPELAACLRGACKFMERLYASLHPSGSYTQGDCLFLSGSDDDIVAFWPSIEGAVADLPLLD